MVKSWMVIGGVTLLLALLIGSLTPRQGAQWFRRLQRPKWLTFEKLIPLIWTTVFVCGAWSAVLVWEQAPGTPQTWGLMAGYLLLELVTLAYNPAMLMTRSLRVGTGVGAAGFGLGLLLTGLVWPVSGTAALLLVPYLLWSPIGTYTTWAMGQLNPNDL